MSDGSALYKLLCRSSKLTAAAAAAGSIGASLRGAAGHGCSGRRTPSGTHHEIPPIAAGTNATAGATAHAAAAADAKPVPTILEPDDAHQ